MPYNLPIGYLAPGGGTMRLCSVVAAGLGLLVLFSGGVLLAQSELATITGVITDSSQAVIPNVSVTIRNVDTNEPRTIKTNVEGYYTVTNLSPGKYELVAESAG